MPQTIFIADLHLSDDTIELNQLFYQALKKWQGKIDALYILGDLFEVWLGDDAASETAQQVAINLQEFSQHTPIYFICGNRDFLLGQTYAKQAGLIRLPENDIIELYGKTYLITHGDEMCTDDKPYQRFRYIMRNRMIQKMLLALSLKKRQQIAHNMRAASKQRKQEIGRSEISDVTEIGVQTSWRKFPYINAIIHGHTHRPNIHQHYYKNQIITRYVLPDWYHNQGGYLLVTPEGISLEKLIYQNT